MNDQIINRVIYGLLALSTILAVVLGASVFIQLHAEGPESLSWNSWLDFFQLIGADSDRKLLRPTPIPHDHRGLQLATMGPK